MELNDEKISKIKRLLTADLALKIINERRMPKAKKYTQKEAEQMADMLYDIYLITLSLGFSSGGRTTAEINTTEHYDGGRTSI